MYIHRNLIECMRYEYMKHYGQNNKNMTIVYNIYIYKGCTIYIKFNDAVNKIFRNVIGEKENR